jgi:hypothetical protein
MQARLNTEGSFRPFQPNGMVRSESQITMGANGAPEIENEEEVIERQDEYLEHPMFGTLVQYDMELKDFIDEN